MRQIEFRGYDFHSSKWVYGYYSALYTNGQLHHFIADVYGEKYEVHGESVGEYIGLDINDIKIYEGDILKMPSNHKLGYVIGFIQYDHEELDFKLAVNKKIYADVWEYLFCLDDTKILGNLFENPELKKKFGECHSELVLMEYHPDGSTVERRFH